MPQKCNNKCAISSNTSNNKITYAFYAFMNFYIYFFFAKNVSFLVTLLPIKMHALFTAFFRQVFDCSQFFLEADFA